MKYGPLEFEYAEGNTLDEMRTSFRKTTLYERGDARLIWANEGDLCMLAARPAIDAAEVEAVAKLMDETAKYDDSGYCEESYRYVCNWDEIARAVIAHFGGKIAETEKAGEVSPTGQ